jgi:hypothetical protein
MGRLRCGFSALHKHDKRDRNSGDQRSHQRRPRRISNELVYPHTGYSPLWVRRRTSGIRLPLRSPDRIPDARYKRDTGTTFPTRTYHLSRERHCSRHSVALPGAPAVYFLEYPFQGLPTERGIPEHHRTRRRSRVVLSYNERAMRDVTKVGAFVRVVDTYAFSEAQGDG